MDSEFVAWQTFIRVQEHISEKIQVCMKAELSAYNCTGVFKTAPRRTDEGNRGPAVNGLNFVPVLELCRSGPGSNVLNSLQTCVGFYVMLDSQPEQLFKRAQQHDLHRTSVKYSAFNVFHRRSHVE